MKDRTSAGYSCLRAPVSGQPAAFIGVRFALPSRGLGFPAIKARAKGMLTGNSEIFLNIKFLRIIKKGYHLLDSNILYIRNSMRKTFI